jgi:thiosulfate dehydrogenase
MNARAPVALVVVVAATVVVLAYRQGRSAASVVPAGVPRPAPGAAFTPPPDSTMPNNQFGEMVRLGQRIFRETGRSAPRYTGNALTCANCHIDGGRLANSAPLWAAYVSYPAYRSKNKHVNTFQERIQGCFRYSMNGKAPPLGDTALVALESYAYWLATGAPVNTAVAGRGYPTPPAPAMPPDYGRGARVFAQHCALCHGPDGQGQRAGGAQVFPPLWGPESFNWGAGMGDVDKAAGFVKANMPLGLGGTLSDQDAWDVALFVDSHERPQDPRFAGSVAETRTRYHDSGSSMYGRTVNGVLLGAHSQPAGGSTRAPPPKR